MICALCKQIKTQTHTEGRPGEDTQRRWPSPRQGAWSREEPALPTLGSRTPSLWDVSKHSLFTPPEWWYLVMSVAANRHTNPSVKSFCLFIREREITSRGSKSRRSRAGSPMWDWILGLQDHDLS